MILKALYDYYHRCGDMPAEGLEEKEIGFLLVLSKEGEFVRIEDCRLDKKSARKFLVAHSKKRASGTLPNYLYDNSSYVLGFSDKGEENDRKHFEAFRAQVRDIAVDHPDSEDMKALCHFYDKGQETILRAVQADPLWDDISRNLTKSFSWFSFRMEGDSSIIAEKSELLPILETSSGNAVCLVTGEHCTPVRLTSSTPRISDKAASLVAFQVNYGFDSYGKQQCANAPISPKAEAAYTTALNYMVSATSRNRFRIADRTFLFWSSSKSDTAKELEESVFSFFNLNLDPKSKDDPNACIANVRKVFKAIYSGELKTDLNERFYILGLAPNAARIAVVHWSEMPLRNFAQNILRHFDDMEIEDTRSDKRPYTGMPNIISAVTRGGKMADATPNLAEAVAKSIFQGTAYPRTLLTACIRRIRAEQNITITRAAIIKATLNRNFNFKYKPMLDKENNESGYLLGRLFAVIVKMQEDANGISSIRERYISAASATPATVFPTILNLSIHHAEKLKDGSKIFYDKLKQEIIANLNGGSFPARLSLEGQGSFYIGYYQQRQDLFKKNNQDNQDNQ